MKQTIQSAIIATAFAASTLASSAALITYDGGIGATARGDGPYTIGNLIEIGSTAITINALGAQDTNGGTGFGGSDGFYSDVTVGVWTSDGSSLLGSVTIPADGTGSTLIDTYRYVALSPDLSTEIVLAANTQYLIGATVGSGVEFFLDAQGGTSPFSADTGVTIVDSMFGAAGAAPTSSSTGDVSRWAAANATFIPEPGSASLLGLAGITLLLRRRRR